jgi:hypothetical protein
MQYKANMMILHYHPHISHDEDPRHDEDMMKIPDMMKVPENPYPQFRTSEYSLVPMV